MGLNSCILRVMRLKTTHFALTLALLYTVNAYAAPSQNGDDLDKLLSEKGLLSQFEQVRQSVSNKASELVIDAMGFLGVPYKRGGNTAETGFDCSGFVRAMYKQSIGLILPRRAEEQAAATQNIEKSDLKPGDLVFFNTLKRTFSHVGIYVGQGRFIHAPSSGSQVRVEDMGTSYWRTRFDGARRVVGTGNSQTAFVLPTTATALPARALEAQLP